MPIAVPLESFYITAVELCIVAILLVFVVDALFRHKRVSNSGLFKNNVIVLLLLYAGHIVYGITVNGIVPTLGDFRQYIPLVLYFPIVSIGLSEHNVNSFRLKSFFVLAVVAVYVLISFMYFQNIFITYAPKEHARILRDRVFFDNTLFLFFMYLGYLIVSLYSDNSGLLKKAFFVIVIFVNILMFIISQTRNLWIMFIFVSMASVLLFDVGFHKLKYVVISTYVTLLFICLIYVGVSVLGYVPSVITKIQHSLVERASSILLIDSIDGRGVRKIESIGSVVTRIETAKVVWNQYIKPNWLFGTGFGTKLPMVYNRQVYLWKYQIDNGYLTILAKFGLIGFLFYLFMFVKIIQSSLAIVTSKYIDNNDRLLVKSIMVGMLAVIFGSVFSSIFIRAQASIVAFVIILCEIEIIQNKLLNNIHLIKNGVDT